MPKVPAKAFGVTKGRRTVAKPKTPPVKRVWATSQDQEAKVAYHRHPISASILDDESLLSKAVHRAVMKWRELTGLEHYGKVYIETESTGETTADENGAVALLVHAFVVVETAPELSAR